jgi:CDP-glucose 4,6-dehydratase
VTGYALAPPTSPSLFEILNLAGDTRSVVGDVRDGDALSKSLAFANPEIIFHLAAQPIVRESYTNLVYTYETNVM